MKIRQEREEDYKAVYALVKEAFEKAEHRDGAEQDLVVALRKSDAFVPELSLVAEIEGRLVGHILFSKAQVETRTILVLAPLSVCPANQKQGIGTALMSEAHDIARNMGYEYSLVLGSEHYYSRVGYQKAENLGIKAPFEVPTKSFMAMQLVEQAESIHGVVRYAKEFGIDL